ncbi:MAG: precorrin-6y C5,15-methyltransferase (decarboxylating) subunit CbiE [Prochlorothrix sp.]
MADQGPELRSIHVVGLGLAGVAGWSRQTVALVQGAAILVGSERHLALAAELAQDQTRETWVLGDLGATIDRLQQWQQAPQSAPAPPALPASTPTVSPAPLGLPTPNQGQYHPENTRLSYAVVLTSGDPLFFGLGRLLLEHLPPHSLHFHPQPSSIQLAFSRIKLPWQDANCISVHGRDLEVLIPLVQRGVEKLAILTDPVNSPGAIAQLLLDLDLPQSYTCSVCENLGGSEERVTQGTPQEIAPKIFASLSVLILVTDSQSPLQSPGSSWPLLGIPDAAFASFPDRPGLMTKREIRVQILGELALQPQQVVWDIGAGTGSVSIEIARLCSQSRVYAIEKTAAGVGLIQTNCDRFGVQNIQTIQGRAPQALAGLPKADRIFIGGSGGNLADILDFSARSLQESGRIVLALATLEHQATVQAWVQQSPDRFATVQWRQVRIDRSASFAHLSRYVPLNPITLITLQR